MGERHSHGGAPDRRAARPDGTRPLDPAASPSVRPAAPAFVPDLDILLAAAVRGGAVDAAREAQAVAAFRAARDQGAYAAHAAPTRRQDDWRPRQHKAKRSLRTTFAVLAASVTLGGVAVAAIGSSSGGNGSDDDQSRTRPSHSAPDHSAPGSAESAAPGSSAPGAAEGADPSAHPSQAQDTEAHCRAYEAVSGRGKALDSTAWQRLIDEAGGEDKVAAYCATQLDEDATGSGTSTGKGDGNGSGNGDENGAAGTTRATPTPAAGRTEAAPATRAATPQPDKSKGKP